MRRVIALELAGIKQLEFDLYDENGKILHEKGAELTPELLMKLSYIQIYKRDEQKHAENLQDAAIIRSEARKTPEPQNISEKSEYKSVLGTQNIEKLINSVYDILSSIEEGVPPKPSVCAETTKTILDEVYQKCDKVANISELRVHDYYTYTHSINTAILSTIIGREIGFGENKVKDLAFSALLHDIGKMKIPKGLLYKKGKLTPDEFDLIKNHAVIGYEFIVNDMKLPEYIAKGALEHHERWLGDGYPKGLKGKEISEFGQIIAIADVFDALISDKVYRASVPSNDAVRIMLTEEAKSFNPEIFHKFAFISVVKNVKIGP